MANIKKEYTVFLTWNLFSWPSVRVFMAECTCIHSHVFSWPSVRVFMDQCTCFHGRVYVFSWPSVLVFMAQCTCFLAKNIYSRFCYAKIRLCFYIIEWRTLLSFTLYFQHIHNYILKQLTFSQDATLRYYIYMYIELIKFPR